MVCTSISASEPSSIETKIPSGSCRHLFHSCLVFPLGEHGTTIPRIAVARAIHGLCNHYDIVTSCYHLSSTKWSELVPFSVLANGNKKRRYALLSPPTSWWQGDQQKEGKFTRLSFQQSYFPPQQYLGSVFRRHPHVGMERWYAVPWLQLPKNAAYLDFPILNNCYRACLFMVDAVKMM